VNVHGMVGRNVNCDLLMEHLNRGCKCAMGNLGSNIHSSDSVTRIGRSIGGLMSMVEHYDAINNIKPECKDHSKRSEAKDLDKIIDELKNLDIFKPVPGRSHLNFPKLYSNPCKKLQLPEFKLWLRC